MRRREFTAVLGGTAAALLWPRGTSAQQAGKVYRISFLGAGLDAPVSAANFQAFRTRLRDLGFVEGQNLTIDHGSTADPRGTFVAAAELMRLQPDLIVATGPENSLHAVIGASRAVPVVMMATNFDPLARGYVASLSRPGGNITGVVFRQIELAQKQVEILNQTFPELKRLAMFFDAQSADQFGAAERAAKALKIDPLPVKLENPPYDFAAAFRSAVADRAQMVVVLSSPHFLPHMPQLAARGIEHRLPTMFINSGYVEAGGLMSYGVNFPTMFRRIADYVARILKGEKPADLPVEQATTFETVVNLKTAKAIGIELPTSILLRADKVIE
jgi:putative ABC transport system substrate-binding protein